MEGIATEMEKLAKVVAELEAGLKELESKMGESELWVSKEREASKELEGELIVNKE